MTFMVLWPMEPLTPRITIFFLCIEFFGNGQGYDTCFIVRQRRSWFIRNLTTLPKQASFPLPKDVTKTNDQSKSRAADESPAQVIIHEEIIGRRRKEQAVDHIEHTAQAREDLA